MLVRPYLPNDREACLAIVGSNVPDYFLSSDRVEVASFLDSLESYGVRYYVIEDRDRIVAGGGVGVDEFLDARMCWGMVDRTRHKRGLGRLLLFLRLLVGASMGARTASLATILKTAQFFEREGFLIMGGQDNFYAPGMHRRDLFITLDGPTLHRLRRRFDKLRRGRLDLVPGILDEEW